MAAAMGNVYDRGQLEGPLPRHHARRQDAQQLAHGPAPRPGGARPGLRARGVGRAVRPHQGRPDPPARLRRPPLRPAGPRRRPHRPRADPHPAAEGRGRWASTSSWSCKVLRLLARRRRHGRRALVGYWRPTGEFVVFTAKAVVLATGGVGKRWKYTSNSWESTGDGHAMALWAGADLIDMECVQFHPTGMVWPLSVRGILVTEGVRGDGGVLRNSEGKRFMFDYVRRHVPGRDGRHRGGGRHVVRRPHRRPPPARAAAPRRGGPLDQLRGQGRPGQPPRRRLPRHRHRAAPPSTSAGACRRCTTSSRSWPASTSPPRPMEVGPTCHYIMGGVRVDADTDGRHRARALRRRRGGRRHARRQPPGRQLAVRPARLRPAGRASAPPTSPRAAAGRPPSTRARSTRSSTTPLAPFDREDGENPYDIQHDLQETMQALVGIIRTGPELEEALAKLEELKDADGQRVGRGRPRLQPGLEPGHRPARRCSPCRSPWPRAPSTARRAGAATPARTTRGPTPRWARSTSSQRQTGERAASAARRRSGRSRSPSRLPAMPDELRALLRGGDT